MLTILYARQSRERRESLMKKLTAAAEKGKEVFLFVPEQQVLEAEDFVSRLPSAAGIEVTSFRRIANSIFRRYGGLCYRYIGNGAKKIVMWRALSSVREALKEYRSLSLDDMTVIRHLLSTVEEMKIYNVTPSMLEEASEAVEDGRLADKLSDIALIFAAYSAVLHEKHDDASDDIARAAKKLAGKDFFAGKAVFFDSFDGFTPQQELLLREILSQAEVTVTLGYEREDSRRFFDKLRETDRRLRRLAESLSLKIREERTMSGSGEEELALFASRFGRTEPEKASMVPLSGKEEITLLRCPGPYEEARFIAADIARRVREGARYRDFTIVARSTDSYLGILDAALEGAGIPYFLSARKDVTSMTALRMLFLALDIHAYHWREEDVIAYLRCGLSGLTYEECDLLESYAGVWHIAGRRWYDELGWQMNPRGFSPDFTDEDFKKLARLNELRERLVRPLSALFESFVPGATVVSMAAALVNFLLALKIPERLKAEREAEALSGREDEEDYALLYDCLIDSLDQLVEVAGELPVMVREFSQLLLALLAEADVGRLPSRTDEVTVGNADLLRKSDSRFVYILGLSEGEFPAAEYESGCFNREEKEALLAAGIETSPDGERRFSDERLYFYRAVTGARDGVTLTYSYRNREGGEQYPSSFLTDTLSLFPGKEMADYRDLPAERLLYGLPEILEYAVEKGYHLTFPEGAGVVEGKYALDTPLDASVEILLPNEADALFGSKIHLTQSRADRFVNCRFAYHCAYSLKLSEGASGSFERVDIGNFVHRILETFFSLSKDRLKTMEDDEAGALLEKVVADYMAPLQRSNPSKRFASLAARLFRTTKLLVFNLLEEFRHSDFLPTFFELPITASGEGGVRAEEIPVGDGLSVIMTGKIDRVDSFRQGKDVYIRVVDYKTGSKSFSLADLALGLNLQLLIYLFSLSSAKNRSFQDKLGCEGKVLPAGVLYFSLGGKSAEVERRPEAGEGASMEKKILRSGILLKEQAVLEAMESGLAGRFLPVTLSADGTPKAGAATTLETLEGFGRLAEKVQAAIAAIAKELKKGSAEARPLKRPAQNPCDYCRMKPICRVTGREDGRVPSEPIPSGQAPSELTVPEKNAPTRPTPAPAPVMPAPAAENRLKEEESHG